MAQSWLTSTTNASVVMLRTSHVRRFSRREIDMTVGTTFLKNFLSGMSRPSRVLRLPYESAREPAQIEVKGAERMKYILMMTGTKAGVDTYRAWAKKDIDAHMAVLKDINKELSESGEFVVTEGLAGPDQAKVVRGEKDGLPVTD